MLKAHLIIVGKLKDPYLKAIEQEYLKRITLFNLTIHEVKSHSGNKDLEAKEVLAKYHSIQNEGQLNLVLLMENGKQFNSRDFSDWVFQSFSHQGQMVLVIGGAEGHGQSLLELPHSTLSLSKLTYPHQLARVILIEQLYRVQTIQQGHPYHK